MIFRLKGCYVLEFFGEIKFKFLSNSGDLLENFEQMYTDRFFVKA